MAKLFAADGQVYYALVTASNLPQAYSKAKRDADNQGFKMGVLSEL